MASTNNCLLRLADVRTMAWYTAGAFDNLTGGMWEKFTSNGSGTNDADFPISKPKDFKLDDTDQQRYLFDKAAQGKLYSDTLTKAGPASKVYLAKRQSSMLSSMLQAIGQRYGTRIRHMAAATTRRTSIAYVDADMIAQDIGIS